MKNFAFIALTLIPALAVGSGSVKLDPLIAKSEFTRDCQEDLGEEVTAFLKDLILEAVHLTDRGPVSLVTYSWVDKSTITVEYQDINRTKKIGNCVRKEAKSVDPLEVATSHCAQEFTKQGVEPQSSPCSNPTYASCVESFEVPSAIMEYCPKPADLRLALAKYYAHILKPYLLVQDQPNQSKNAEESLPACLARMDQKKIFTGNKAAIATFAQTFQCTAN